jgi:bacillolysin
MVGREIRVSIAAVAALILFTPAVGHSQRPMGIAATRDSMDELRAADRLVDQMIRSRALVATSVEGDPLVGGRRHERFEQFARGVRIAGGDITRQTASDGTVSLFGFLHDGVPLDVVPRLSPDDAAAAIARAAGGDSLGASPELVILPLSDGYHLAYYGQATAGLEIQNVFVDANNGAPLRQFSDFIREVGHGKGAYGDDKKVSARGLGGTFVTDDPLRPAAITTYDMRGDLARLTTILNRFTPVAPSDISSDADNDWTDPTVVDAHVYAGWYYDFLFKRFARRGLDNRDLRMAMFTHPVRQQDIGTASSAVVGLYYLNAFFCRTCLTDGRGAMVFGEGAPLNFFPGIEVKPFSAALDVVAHELTHGVTANSANLNGFPFSEAGSLNEAFSDIFGAATAFFFQPAGTAPLNANYTTGRDLTIPPGLLSRSMSDPTLDGDPDHYTKRITGADPHFNSTIASHAFYLAIEGGTNRTSGQVVAGVGAASREQIEKAFFRALTVLLPSNATFALTRTATIQAAQDLYGAGSAAVRAITQAWDAVGVQPRVAPTATLLPNPARGTAASSCGDVAPSWTLGITVSAGASNLRVTQWSPELFDASGRSVDRETLTGADFGAFFNQCGPGSATILAQADACAGVCVALGGAATGAAQITFTALDDAGRVVTFATPRVPLLAPR